jgi:hypothetical protein
LEKAGYSKGSLEGIKLAKIEQKDGTYLMPYLDGGVNNLVEYSNYFEVTDCSTHLVGNSTSGTLVTEICPCCGEYLNRVNTFYINDLDRNICEYCFNDNYISWDCEYYNIEACTRVNGGVFDGMLIPNDLLADNNYVELEEENTYWHIDCVVETYFGVYLEEDCVRLEEEHQGDSYAPEWACTRLEDYDSFGDYQPGWYVTSRYEEILEEREEKYVETPTGWGLKENCIELVEAFKGFTWAHEDVAYYYDKPTNHAKGWYYEERYNEVMEEFELQSNLFTYLNIAA